ncbi:hypothetical protein ACFX11_039289 [Malus domestica]
MKMICEDAVISWYSCSVFGFALKEFLGNGGFQMVMVQLSASLSNTQMSSLADLKPPPPRKGMFHFSAESLAKLKAKANAESGTTKISSFQFLSVLLWRSITRAHCQPPNQGTSCRHGLQGSICNYKSALVVIVPGNGIIFHLIVYVNGTS